MLDARGLSQLPLPFMRSLCMLVSLLSLVACRRSEAELEAEFNSFVEKHDDCEKPTDCTRVNPGCPLGCLVAVRVDAARRAERLAADLVDEYQRFGARCDYECVGSWGVACQQGRCEVCDESDGGAGEQCVRPAP